MASKEQKLDIKSISANNYIAAVAVITILLVSIAGIALYLFINSIILNAKLISHKNEANKVLKQNVINADKLITGYTSLGNAKDLINDALPAESDFPQLVASAENMANAAGVRLTSVAPAVNVSSSTTTPASTTPQNAGTTLPTPYDFRIDVTGNYAGMAKLAENLQLSARPMRVVDTQFKGETSDLKVEFTIETYYQGKADISTKQQVIK